MKIFSAATIGKLTLKNRIIRSATFEGMCDDQGFPKESYHNLYSNLSKNDIGAIITGFAYIDKEGKAIQPGQAGIDHSSKIPYYKKVCETVHNNNSIIFMQLAHCGRQTDQDSTGGNVWGVSSKKSKYFRSKPQKMSIEKIQITINQFARAALFAKKSGFDGVQIHAAHGYLVHQFLLPQINNRKDIFGVNPKTKIGTEFLSVVIDKIRIECGRDFPILVKISGDVDYLHNFSKKQFVNLIHFLDNKKVDGIEISYGTMDQALNIFRGKTIPYKAISLFNPRYKLRYKFLFPVWKLFATLFLTLKIKKFTSAYNLNYATLAKQHTDIPIICVGGFQTGQQIETVIQNKKLDFVSICRALLCEPDFVKKLKSNPKYKSKCISCNICAIMCDSQKATKCYFGKIE